MPIRQVVASENNVYHICNRGALKMTLFFNPYMYELFLQLVELYATRYSISILAICLMPNHIHIMIRVDPGGDVPRFARCVFGTFSKRINHHLRRTGTIYQGRYYMKRVTSDSYLKNAYRYIHLNPFKAGLVAHPADWAYSDFQEALLQRNHIRSEHQFVREVFGNAAVYESFVVDNMHRNYIEDEQFARDLADLGLV